MSIGQLSQRKQEKLRRSWRDQHSTKRVHASRALAWLAVARVLRDDILGRKMRREDIRLCPYRCRWGEDWRDGRSYPVHWHIGHHRYGPVERMWRPLQRGLVKRYRWRLLYPWRRSASRVRIAIRTRSLARHPGWHKSRRRGALGARAPPDFRLYRMLNT